MSELHLPTLIDKIDNKEANITVIGLGKMGLPIAMVFTHAGYSVMGYDINQKLVDMLNLGRTQLVNEPGVETRLQQAVDQGKFQATTDIKEAASNADFVIIIIPILDNESGEQELSILLDTYEQFSKHAKPGIIYMQESTLAPGTTSGKLKQILEQYGKVSGKDFGLVFAPERTFSGRVLADIEENYPKLVGGDTVNAAQAAARLYDKVVNKGVMILSNATTAETVKTFKGAYRDANIAIANQFAILADLFEVDILEVINAANSEPSSHIHTPGIGVGGHCIPVYPHFVISQGNKLGYNPNLLVTARQANLFMAEYAIQTLDNHLDDWGNVLVLGLAYRGGVKEFRNSPAIILVPMLRSKTNTVNIADPLYDKEEINQLFGEKSAVKWHVDVLKQYDTIIIVTDHREFEGIEEYLQGKYVFDGRYVVDHKNATDFKLFQPGRLVLSKKE